MPRLKKRRSRDINKSELIREFLRDNKRATPTEIREAMAMKGIEVSPSLVSFVKYRGKKPKRRKAVPGALSPAPAISKARKGDKSNIHLFTCPFSEVGAKKNKG
jgi:hypothetical protein